MPAGAGWERPPGEGAKTLRVKRFVHQTAIFVLNRDFCRVRKIDHFRERSDFRRISCRLGGVIRKLNSSGGGTADRAWRVEAYA